MCIRMFHSHPIQCRRRALGEYSLAFPPNLLRVGPHGHSLYEVNVHQLRLNSLTNRQLAANDHTHSPSMQSLPLQDLLPGLLIVLIVDFNDVGHVTFAEVIISPAPPAAQDRTKETVSLADISPSLCYCNN